MVVVGNGAVGKTSMIRRYCRGIYTDEYKKTIGVRARGVGVQVDV